MTFTQSYGRAELDASLLMIPLVGFLPATDPRMVGTVAAIERELMRRRLRPPLRRREPATSTACRRARARSCRAASGWPTTWLLQGRTGEAPRAVRAARSASRNDVGLLAEEYDPARRRLVGNFPQAFSHVALVNTAHNLGTGPSPARERGEAP